MASWLCPVDEHSSFICAKTRLITVYSLKLGRQNQTMALFFKNGMFACILDAIGDRISYFSVLTTTYCALANNE
jgi:hypothetical protein